ncbi:MAG: hypothetical protein KKD28_08390 [Chloroflexi bacterium]|nr:hypothetical protein [Chloroflexota bacterium]
MSTENTSPPKPSFGRRIVLAVKAFLRAVLLVLISLILVTALVLVGSQLLGRGYFMQSVDKNTSQIHDLSIRHDQDNELITQRLADLLVRLNVLEIQSDTDKQTIADLQTQLTAAEEALQEQATSLENVPALQVALDEYGAALTALETWLEGYDANLEGLQSDVDNLSQSAEADRAEIQALSEKLQTQDTLVTLRHELELLKAMELITRARVSIGQHNIGLAQDDLQAARELLSALSAEVPEYQAASLADIILRLELAEKNLVEAPDLVDQDLEVAWQLLLPGLQSYDSTDDATSTPTATPTTGDDAEATPTPTATLTPKSEVEATPTPTPTP